MEENCKTMTRPCFFCHFFDKTRRHFSYWRHENRFFQVLQKKILQGRERAPKIATFCYYNFFLCQKKPIFFLFANLL